MPPARDPTPTTRARPDYISDRTVYMSVYVCMYVYDHTPPHAAQAAARFTLSRIDINKSKIITIDTN